MIPLAPSRVIPELLAEALASLPRYIHFRVGNVDAFF